MHTTALLSGTLYPYFYIYHFFPILFNLYEWSILFYKQDIPVCSARTPQSTKLYPSSCFGMYATTIFYCEQNSSRLLARCVQIASTLVTMITICSRFDCNKCTHKCMFLSNTVFANLLFLLLHFTGVSLRDGYRANWPAVKMALLGYF